MSPRRARALRGGPFAVPTFFVLILIVMSLPAARADAEGSPPVELPATTVRAFRLPVSEPSTSATADVLDRGAIQNRAADSLGELLDGLSGLRVERYGPFGALETVSFLGSGASNVLVVVDGVRINSPQNGLTDLSLWPGGGWERVETVGGGLSALYGADAAGGIILLQTARLDPAMRLALESRLGSFGSRGIELAGTLPTGETGLRLRFARDVAENDYPYEWRGVPRTRWNADVQRNTADLRWDLPLAGRWTLIGRAVRKRNGVAGPETGAVPAEDAVRPRQWDRDGFLSLTGSFALREWAFETSVAARASYQRYRDMRIGIDSQHRNRTAEAHLSVRRDVGRFRVLTGVDLDGARIRSTDVLPASRRHLGVFGVLLRTFPVRRGIEWVQVDVAMRWDRYDDFGDAFSPRLGLVATRGRLRLFANAGRSFRAPTFNDLYWAPGGNPTLHPERATTATLGLRWTGRILSAELSHLRTDYRDQIRWLPDATGTWSPRNFARTDVRGGIARVSLRHGPWRATVRGSYTEAIQRSDPTHPGYGKQVPFVPRVLASGEIAYATERLSASLRYRRVGKVFTRPDHLDSLPAYGLWSVAVRDAFAIGGAAAHVQLNVDNLTGRTYRVQPQYPMPGRALRLAFGIEF